jgi:hypothetical protein
LLYREVGSPMRKFLTSGRRRYALAFVVVGASLAIMGAQCQPPKQPAPPAPPSSGLKIAPTVGDFGSQPVSGGKTAPIKFTVTNNGPGATGNLATSVVPSAPDFVLGPDNCNGTSLANKATCTIDVTFDPSATGGQLVNLRVKDPSDGEVTAVLGGVGT